MSSENNSNNYMYLRRAKSFLLKHKFLSCILVVALIFLFLSQFIAIGFPSSNGGVFSVSFDRWNMRRVNRIEVTFIGSDVIAQIECRRLIRSFVRETTAACATGLNNWGQNTFHLYRNETLVRSMIGSLEHSAVTVNFNNTGRVVLLTNYTEEQQARAQTVVSWELLNAISYYLHSKGYGDLLPPILP